MSAFFRINLSLSKLSSLRHAPSLVNLTPKRKMNNWNRVGLHVSIHLLVLPNWLTKSNGSGPIFNWKKKDWSISIRLTNGGQTFRQFFVKDQSADAWISQFTLSPLLVLQMTDVSAKIMQKPAESALRCNVQLRFSSLSYI